MRVAGDAGGAGMFRQIFTQTSTVDLSDIHCAFLADIHTEFPCVSLADIHCVSLADIHKEQVVRAPLMRQQLFTLLHPLMKRGKMVQSRCFAFDSIGYSIDSQASPDRLPGVSGGLNH
ncbi:hypothetical protein RRG08_013778 [Elysia crispata]|uniref:Uncharacterized protein n=1 Tax=Elysia crispata TaxID=231223 RepID=A0AAE1DRP8_9GAST|nr:hypothetical protein RRG08_013778 [Elysia crispata]